MYYLNVLITEIKKLPTTKIVWDTVLKSSTTFDFFGHRNQETLKAF
jgi:hydroxymethylpyrimidine/phosphomethylpyrimidine kinase